MKAEHRIIIEAAEKEGLSPCEKDARLVVHDMVNATRKAMCKYEVGYNKMTEKQQDAVLGDLEAAFKELALIIARTIASGGTPAISMTLKDMKISNGTVTGIVDGSDKHFNDLISKVQDKSEVMVVLYERQYADAMDAIQSDKDQRSLPLDDKAPAGKKPSAAKGKGKAAAETKIELTPKLVTDGRDFVTIQQNASIAGLQNHLKIGFAKAEALLKLYEGEGLVKFVGTDETGQYELVREPKTESINTGTANGASGNPDQYGELSYSEVQQTIVLRADKFPLEWLSERFKIDEEHGSHLALRLMDDGVIEAIQPEDLDADAHEYKVIAKLEDLVI